MMSEMYLNLIFLFAQKEVLTLYEELYYKQLLITLKQRARLDELLLIQAVEETKNAQGINQTSGGASQQDSKTEEHRSDDQSSTV